mgnify:FL=1
MCWITIYLIVISLLLINVYGTDATDKVNNLNNIDNEGVITIILDYDFSTGPKYMTSIEMGRVCHRFVLDNIKKFGFTNVDEILILRKANEICSHYATQSGREYIGVDFLRSFYPYVKRNELTNIYDKYNTGMSSS